MQAPVEEETIEQVRDVFHGTDAVIMQCHPMG
jgi:hypothetical protein